MDANVANALQSVVTAIRAATVSRERETKQILEQLEKLVETIKQPARP